MRIILLAQGVAVLPVTGRQDFLASSILSSFLFTSRHGDRGKIPGLMALFSDPLWSSLHFQAYPH